MRRLLLTTTLLLSSQAVWAEAFTECPSRAFLTQGTVAQTYGVNLVTGDFNLVQADMGTWSKVNATGFNPNDQYMYGWSYEHHVPARIDSDFKVEPLITKEEKEKYGIVDADFFVGDVSLTNNTYYVYRSGSSYGLYAISLDGGSDDYLKMTQVIDGSSLSLKIYDLAFHPTNGYAYAVDKDGKLHKIDAQTGASKEISDTGQTGTFGAVYFDVDENLYISRNSDGKVFKVAIGSENYTAELFAQGPSSSINDGARCALAPVISLEDTNIDFGDAPDSYGTTIANGGARHGLEGDNTLFLGVGVDGESDGQPYPLSDDESDLNDDEDGVQFATGLQAGETAVIMVNPSETGILSAWLDSNGNGVFDHPAEQIIIDQTIAAGKQPIYIKVPEGSMDGETWARFRLSTSTGMEPTGGVSDGEVEDYSVTITAKEGATVSYYPSRDGWTTVAFEDNWPYEGDYDMNDLVTYMRTSVFRTDGKVTLVNISGELAALGAAYQNGFGIRLPGVLRDQIDEESINYTINNRAAKNDYSPLESGPNEAIFIMTYNTWNYASAGEGCVFYRTEEGCGSDIQMSFDLTIPFKEPVDSDISGIFDPFLFATPGAEHGVLDKPGRSYEIHLKNQEPTEVFDKTLMNMGLEGSSDGSSPDDGFYFQTNNGLPYAMEMGNRWQYPKEYRDLVEAYPQFPSYVESAGEENPAWFSLKNAVESILFKN